MPRCVCQSKKKSHLTEMVEEYDSQELLLKVDIRSLQSRGMENS